MGQSHKVFSEPFGYAAPENNQGTIDAEGGC